MYCVFFENQLTRDESESELSEEELPSATELREATPSMDGIPNSTDVAIVKALERAENMSDFQVPH